MPRLNVVLITGIRKNGLRLLVANLNLHHTDEIGSFVVAVDHRITTIHKTRITFVCTIGGNLLQVRGSAKMSYTRGSTTPFESFVSFQHLKQFVNQASTIKHFHFRTFTSPHSTQFADCKCQPSMG